MDDSINQVIFIVVGVIIAYIIESATKLIASFKYIKKANFVHIGYCLMTPIVIWQFAYQLPKTLSEINNPNLDFIMGLWVLVNVSLMAGLSKLVYPDLSDNNKIPDDLYLLDNSLYRKHLRMNRRPFYFVLSIYLFSMTAMFASIGRMFDWAEGIRIIMASMSLLYAAIEYKPKVSICRPWGDTNYNLSDNNLENEIIQRKYYILDKVALLSYFGLFVIYLIFRNTVN